MSSLCQSASCTEIVGGLRSELRAAQAESARLLVVVEDQAKALAAVTDDVPSFAPSLAIVYWLWSLARGTEKNWRVAFNRIRPLVSDIGELPAPLLTPLAWDQHRARRSLEIIPRTGAPPLDTTLNAELERAKEMLNFAVDNKLIKFNPLLRAKTVKTVTHRDTRLTPEEVDRLVAAAPLVKDGRRKEGGDDGLRTKVLVAFALCCHDSMLRFNEARNLRRGLIRDDGRVELASRETKGGKRRTVFLTPRTLSAIAELPADPQSPFVFAEGGRQIHERRIHYWFRALCEAAGVDESAAPGEKQIRPHDLRASGATTADEHGARTTAIRDALGHSRLATTEVYLRSGQAENARSVAGVIEAATTRRRGPKRAPPKKVGGVKHFPVATQARR